MAANKQPRQPTAKDINNNWKLQLNIIDEAEKLYGADKCIQIITRNYSVGTFYQVAIVDKYGTPVEYVTGSHTSLLKLLDSLKSQNTIHKIRKNERTNR